MKKYLLKTNLLSIKMYIITILFIMPFTNFLYQINIFAQQSNTEHKHKMEHEYIHKKDDNKAESECCKQNGEKEASDKCKNIMSNAEIEGKQDSCQHMNNHSKLIKKDTSKTINMNMNKVNNTDMIKDKNKPSIIREGEIDLIAIDANKDGKVFQDFMDWNVLSDKPGKCPICEMKLKEVTIEKAKENLLKHGFKVK